MSTHADHPVFSVIRERPGLRTLAPGVAKVALSAALGLAVGIATFIAQGHLSGPWAALANSVSAWLVAPWLVGLLCARRRAAAAAGLACCLLQLVGYDAYAHLRGDGVDLSTDMYWALAAVAGGPVFGLAGHAWRFEPASLRGIGPAALAAAFISEGLVSFLHNLHDVSIGVLWLAIAAAIVALTLRGRRQWRWLGVAVPIGLVLMAAFIRLPL